METRKPRKDPEEPNSPPNDQSEPDNAEEKPPCVPLLLINLSLCWRAYTCRNIFASVYLSCQMSCTNGHNAGLNDTVLFPLPSC